MKKEIFEIVQNKEIARGIFEMTLCGDVSDFSAAGQFAQVALKGFFLRRPISVCDVDENRLTLVYKVAGMGTEAMSTLTSGKKIDLLCGLGNGFRVERCSRAALLAGGGVGVPPLLLLAKRLAASGKKVFAMLGFNTARDIILVDRFVAAGAEVKIATMDGTAGEKGLVTDILPDEKFYDYFYACGPRSMLKALCEKISTGGEISLEERMGCGFGACMGCAVKTSEGVKRVCADGPVFDKEAVIW